MTYLTVYTDSDDPETLLETDDLDEIDAALKEIDVRLRHWPVLPAEAAGGSQEEILDAYKDEVARIVAEEGYVHVDVSRLHRTGESDEEWAAKAAEARRKFLAEHTHDDDEDRYFARGAGVFYLHIGDKVYAVYCTAGDLLSVPANTTHWFDMGTEPDYVSIRFFHDDDGWIGNFTGSDIATKFPTFDELRAGH